MFGFTQNSVIFRLYGTVSNIRASLFPNFFVVKKVLLFLKSLSSTRTSGFEEWLEIERASQLSIVFAYKQIGDRKRIPSNIEVTCASAEV